MAIASGEQRSVDTATLPLIPVFRPSIGEEESRAVVETLRSGWLGPGPRVKEFEDQFAAAFGVRRAIAVSTGTAALQAALAVLNVGPGDEIILPSFTWVSIFQVVIGLGATPVFCDIEPEYLTVDPVDAARLVTRRAKAIVAVHHGGQLADLAALRAIAESAGVTLIDDAAHACGSEWQGEPVGKQTSMTCFSFNAMKNLAIGDGGMVTTQDESLARKLALFRSLGIDRDTYARYGDGNTQQRARWEYDVESVGQRLHMNDIAASIGLVQLRHLNELNQRRVALVARYDSQLRDVKAFRFVRPRPHTRPSHHMYTVRMAERDAFIEKMRAVGISIGVHYIPIHLFGIAKPYRRSLPVTEKVWREVTTFPLYPDMTREEQDRVIQAARAIAC